MTHYWLTIDSLLTHYWLTIDSLLTYYWLTIDLLLTYYWLTIDSLMTHYWLTIDSRLTHYWLTIDSLLAHYLTSKAVQGLDPNPKRSALLAAEDPTDLQELVLLPQLTFTKRKQCSYRTSSLPLMGCCVSPSQNCRCASAVRGVCLFVCLLSIGLCMCLCPCACLCLCLCLRVCVHVCVCVCLALPLTVSLQLITCLFTHSSFLSLSCCAVLKTETPDCQYSIYSCLVSAGIANTAAWPCICTLTQSHTPTLPHNAYHLYLLLWFNQRNSRQRFLLLILWFSLSCRAVLVCCCTCCHDEIKGAQIHSHAHSLLLCWWLICVRRVEAQCYSWLHSTAAARSIAH